MTKTFTASMKDWSEKAKRNVELVVKQSAQDVSEQMTRPQPSVKETGGSFELGKVPVDIGTLRNSLQSAINGGVIGQGPDSYVGVIAGMKMGDRVEVAFTAEYATHVNYGTSKMAGRFFVTLAAEQWVSTVAANAARLAD